MIGRRPPIEPPELWWSSSAAEARGNPEGGVLTRGHDGRPETVMPPYESETLDAWPDDAVRLVPRSGVARFDNDAPPFGADLVADQPPHLAAPRPDRPED